MPKYQFVVVGLRHHDYEGKLDELYANAEGKSMGLQLEEENVMERDAVRVYLADKFVGYVKTGPDRMLAAEILKGERLSVLGKVIEINRETRMITIEVDADAAYECKGWEKDRIMRKWKYNGDLLRQSDEEVSLKYMLNILQMNIEQQNAWDDTLELYFDFIRKNLWRDAGVQTQQQVDSIFRLLTVNANAVKGYKEAATKLLYVMTDVNSPEQRQHQVDYLYELSQTEEMNILIDRLGNKAVRDIEKIPVVLQQLFDDNPQEYIGRLRYMHCDYKQTRQLQTLMAMRIAVKHYQELINVDADDILVNGEETVVCLRNAVKTFFKKSTKDLALIYCVLRDNNLLVDNTNYIGFVKLLLCEGLLFMTTDKKIRNLATSIGQYMRDRKDHGKMRGGFIKSYTMWDESKDRSTCESIALFFAKGK